jgi:hypothetical protein
MGRELVRRMRSRSATLPGMARKSRSSAKPPGLPASDQGDIRSLPRKALERIHLGQSFAEYDPYLKDDSVFVHTPALTAAIDPKNPHCFFVGRRGTGKTTITRFLEGQNKRALGIRPEMFSPSDLKMPLEDFEKSSQKPFRSLLAAFRRSLQDEVLFRWAGDSPLNMRSMPEMLSREYETFCDDDFDLRALKFIDALTEPLKSGDDQAWLTEIKTVKKLSTQIRTIQLSRENPYVILIDAIDDSWDGSDLAVLYLSALMHACLEINTQVEGMRVLIFLRENMFERVRVIDSEFSRLETCVVGLDWTREQLLELIERRINSPLNTKLALGGQTWNAFFEDGELARNKVLDYCQHRPRDVLTYCHLALDTAQAHKHERVMIEDLQDARRRFSDSRLSDLSDEYQENYPQIALVLERFHALGDKFTISGMEDFLDKLLEDDQVTTLCSTWIYTAGASTEQFVRLLYEIGFIGLRDLRGDAPVIFRSLGPRDTTPPPLSERTEIQIHPSYVDALALQDRLVGSLVDGDKLRRSGIILELPGAVNMEQYREQISGLQEELKNLQKTKEQAGDFEHLVGEIIRLCFFRSLQNISDQVRDTDGAIRRDWVASNRARYGFWEMLRHRHDATQVLFECKNYSDLKASDFQQASYYMADAVGKIVFLIYRGSDEKRYYQHIKRIFQNTNGLVLLLTDKDLAVFMRQALAGRVKDDHLQDRYDRTVRSIS